MAICAASKPRAAAISPFQILLPTSAATKLARKGNRGPVRANTPLASPVKALMISSFRPPPKSTAPALAVTVVIQIVETHATPDLYTWKVAGDTDWVKPFDGSGDAGFMRLHRHMLSDYAAAATAAGLRIRSLQELPLTPESAITVASERLPEANQAAWVGLPGVVVWEFEKP